MWGSISIIRAETQARFLPEEVPVSDGEPMKERRHSEVSRRAVIRRSEISIGECKRQEISGDAVRRLLSRALSTAENLFRSFVLERPLLIISTALRSEHLSQGRSRISDRRLGCFFFPRSLPRFRRVTLILAPG